VIWYFILSKRLLQYANLLPLEINLLNVELNTFGRLSMLKKWKDCEYLYDCSGLGYRVLHCLIVLLPLYRATDNWSPPKSNGYIFWSSITCSNPFTVTVLVTFCDGTYLCEFKIMSIISSYFISFFNWTPSGTY